MPIETAIPLCAVTQEEFAVVAYEVVGHAFSIHETLGRKFDESAYRSALAHLLGARASAEVGIRLTHGSFEKRYSIDLVVGDGCLFELKVATELHAKHRQQLIQYLMLADVRHGKLINFGGERVQHEFVNSHETAEHRRSFRIDAAQWTTVDSVMSQFQEIVVGLLRDWGIGLGRGLYCEALTHLLGGPEIVRQSIDIVWDGVVIGRQNTELVDVQTGFEISGLRQGLDEYETHLRRFLDHSSLKRILWVNVVSGCVRFAVLRR